MRIEAYLNEVVSRAVQTALELDAPPAALVRSTQDSKHGDYQANGLMALGKQLKQSPRELGARVLPELTALPAVASAEVAGPGFVNLRLSDEWLAQRLETALRDVARDGVDRVQQPERVVIDFSSPNVAKAMHVGHLRSTILGDALSRILRFVGHDVTADNHIGDWGTQFGLLIAGMRRFGSEERLVQEPIEELERVYREASQLGKTDEAFADEARTELAKLQAGDPVNEELWKRFGALSRPAFESVYDRLGVHFDTWLGESHYNDRLAGVVQMLQERGFAREDQGAICVFFNEIEQAPADLKRLKAPFIIRKKDGAFLYSTTDIATLFYRRDELHAERAIYVVDVRQAPHFKQLFGVAQLLDIPIELEHVGFGMVLGSDGRPLRTRDGGNVRLQALLDEAEQRARQRIEEQKLNIEGDALERVSHVVGLGAVKYADLRQNRVSDYTFDWDKLISFQGNAGPYLQYAYARIQSILRKGQVSEQQISGQAPIALEAEAEQSLARRLVRFSDVVHQAADTCQPHLICEHLYDLSKTFSGFYEACPILRSESPVRERRLALAVLVARQLRRGLDLLGIEVVDRM